MGFYRAYIMKKKIRKNKMETCNLVDSLPQSEVGPCDSRQWDPSFPNSVDVKERELSYYNKETLFT